MTLLNLFSSRANVGGGEAQSDDRSIMLMVRTPGPAAWPVPPSMIPQG